jgi:hypothetical protein
MSLHELSTLRVTALSKGKPGQSTRVPSCPSPPPHSVHHRAPSRSPLCSPPCPSPAPHSVVVVVVVHVHVCCCCCCSAAAAAAGSLLFASLDAWFTAQQQHLAHKVPHAAIEVTLRVFLAPQQSVRQGIQHVTFSVDWVRPLTIPGPCWHRPSSGSLALSHHPWSLRTWQMRVATGNGAPDEPLARALLQRLGMGDRTPPKMLLVVM